jgi:hypothetical protein
LPCMGLMAVFGGFQRGQAEPLQQGIGKRPRVTVVTASRGERWCQRRDVIGQVPG